MPQLGQTVIATGGEEVGPEARPLLVDVAIALLEGYGGGEDDGRRQPGQALHQRLRRLRRKMLGDLEAQGEIEPPAQLQRPAQLVLVEQSRGDLQIGAGHPGAVDATNVGDAVLAEGREPQAGAAADIDDALGPEQLDQHGRDDRRGPLGPLGERFEEAGTIGNLRRCRSVRGCPLLDRIAELGDGCPPVAHAVSATLSERKCDRAIRRRGHGAVFSHRLTTGANALRVRIAGIMARMNSA